jgi:1,4-alpha-glucan branching enzyme
MRYFEEEAFKRLEIAAVWLMTTVGLPQIWMGEEWGEDKILGKLFDDEFFIESFF